MHGLDLYSHNVLEENVYRTAYVKVLKMLLYQKISKWMKQSVEVTEKNHMGYGKHVAIKFYVKVYKRQYNKIQALP